LPKVSGVVAVYTQGRGAWSRPFAVRAAVTLGRSDADLVLDDAKASRRHASLAPAAGGVMVTDLESRNGVLVDGERIDSARFAPFGSIVRVGHTLLVVVDDVACYGHDVDDTEALLGGGSLATVRQQIRQAARANMALLIEGESGVGKELVAESVHRQSASGGELVAVNCAAIPSELIEAELFGHVRGAFSGAEGSRRGLVRSAHGGTLFLDEIGEMPLDTQAKLLRVLESGEVRPVGEDRVERVDVRFVAATNVALDAMVERGAFRTDLFHRIAAVRISVPPLRDRREDVPLLTQAFIAQLGSSLAPSVEAMERLMRHAWPGNVRELKNAVRFALSAMGDAPGATTFGPASLPDTVREAPSPAADHAERLEEALRAAGGNVSEAARALGMRRATVYERLRRLGVDPAQFRRG
jgi:DNA-binding NtrC family response regulator